MVQSGRRVRPKEATASILALVLFTTLLAPVVLASTTVSADAWCYQVGRHSSATLDWEWGGSDINIRWSGDHSVRAVRDTQYSRPTLSRSWVRRAGSSTKLTVGARGRVLATWRHTAFKPYGGTHDVWDGYARRLSADVQACT